jgi:hypothetical protein
MKVTVKQLSTTVERARVSAEQVEGAANSGPADEAPADATSMLTLDEPVSPR